MSSVSIQPEVLVPAFILFPSVPSFLYIASFAEPLILRYNSRDGTALSFNTYTGAAQSISFDQFDNVVYWVNIIENSPRVMKTTLTGITVDLNITYSGQIKVTSDMLNFYVLDKDNGRIDKYLKTSLEKLGNITHEFGIMDLIVGYGECQNSYLYRIVAAIYDMQAHFEVICS